MADKPRILVVEDSQAIRELLRDRLDAYELAFASCQSEAHESLESPSFDLVLLDLNLPRTSSDMNATNQVGLDILREIRQRSLCKRASEMPLPVVVMTAFGDQMLSSEIIVADGADDYMPKPFGDDDALERKIERALAGEGAFARIVRARRPVIAVHLAFHHSADVVWIEGFEQRAATRGLLWALSRRFAEDLERMLAPTSFRGIIGDDLAKQLGIEAKAVRTRVATFRSRVKAYFKQRLCRDLDDNAIVENVRDHNGYRLNPLVVRIIAWDEISTPTGPDRAR